MTVVAGLPFPVSALLFVAGVTWRENPLGGCALSIAALSLNMTDSPDPVDAGGLQSSQHR